MKITKNDLEQVMQKLEWLINEMEINEVDEVKTECNTYGLYNFICFGSNGYLDLDEIENVF